MKEHWSSYEPFFKAWLVLSPMVAYGSHFIIFNARLRLAQLAEDSMSVDDPQGTWGYAVACTMAFTILMLAIARLWVQHSPSENDGAAEDREVEAPTQGN